MDDFDGFTEDGEYDPQRALREREALDAARPRCRCGRLLKCYVYDGRCEDCWVTSSSLCRGSTPKVSLMRDGAPPNAKRSKRGDGYYEVLDGEPLAATNRAVDLVDLTEAVIKAERASALPEPRLTAGERQAANRRQMLRRMFPNMRRVT